MAVEEQKVTGNTKVVDSAKRFADHIDGIFGPNKRYNVDGHQEVEMALIKLYRLQENAVTQTSRSSFSMSVVMHIEPNNPLSPPSAPVQRRVQSPPAKSKLLAVFQNRETRHPARVSRFHRGRP